MRILFALTGTSGHLDPLVPIARAAEAAGHTIAFAGRPSMVRSVEALGFRVFATETGRTEPPPERLPLLALDAEREDSVVRDGFAGRIARQRARDVAGFQALVLPHCAAVVSHGGSGSVLGALAHGVPSVLLPMGADQPLNAARCAALGVSRVLDAMTATPEAIRDAVSAVLSDPTYRSAAERLSAEIDALPEPAHAVTLLERLAAERRPLLNRA